jgi:single-stranded DNA-binding protein
MRAIVSGALARDPEEKTSKSGNAYILATIREGSGESARWVRCFVFGNEPCASVLTLKAGDPIAVAGEIDAEVYAPPGAEARVSWSAKVDAVLTARRARPAAPEQRRGQKLAGGAE